MSCDTSPACPHTESDWPWPAQVRSIFILAGTGEQKAQRVRRRRVMASFAQGGKKGGPVTGGGAADRRGGRGSGTSSGGRGGGGRGTISGGRGFASGGLGEGANGGGRGANDKGSGGGVSTGVKLLPAQHGEQQKYDKKNWQSFRGQGHLKSQFCLQTTDPCPEKAKNKEAELEFLRLHPGCKARFIITAHSGVGQRPYQ